MSGLRGLLPQVTKIPKFGQILVNRGAYEEIKYTIAPSLFPLLDSLLLTIGKVLKGRKAKGVDCCPNNSMTPSWTMTFR
jgi:hypothetical protein